MNRLPAARLGLVLIVACGHASSEGPPESNAAAEPEAPSTAISVLIDEAPALGLTPRQLDQLKALDHELQVLNAPLESKIAAYDKQRAAAGESPRSAPAGGTGLTAHARMGGGGRGGRMMGGGAGRGRGGGAGSSPTGSAPPARRRNDDDKRSAEEATVQAKMTEQHDRALRAAFDLLTPAQRDRATRVLDENGYDPPEAVPDSAARPTPPAPP